MNEQTLSKFCYILRHMTEVTSYEIKIISLVLMMKPQTRLSLHSLVV